MKKEHLLPIIFGVVVILLWEFIIRIFDISLYIMPSPSKIITSLISEKGVLFEHSLVTLFEAITGLVIASVLAIAIAILMDLSKSFKNTIYPYLVISQTIPVLVLGPLLMIWFGFGLTPKIIMVVLMCFFPIVISLSTSLSNVSNKQINLLKSFGANIFEIYYYCKIPSSLESFFNGLRVSATYAISGAIVGEWLSAAKGLGYYMLRVKNGYMLDKVFAVVVIIIVLSLMLNLVVGLLEKVCLPYKRSRR